MNFQEENGYRKLKESTRTSEVNIAFRETATMKNQSVQKLAMLALVFMLGVLFILIRLGMYSYIFILASTIVGIATFLLITYLRDTKSVSSEESWPFNTAKKRRLSCLMSIAFFLSLSMSLLLISPGSSIKPMEYYAVVSICGALIAIDIIFLESKKAILANLAKSFMLTLSIFFSARSTIDIH